MTSTYVVVTVAFHLLFSITGTVGNGVLIIAFICQRNIRTASNYFNLATFVSGLVLSGVGYPLQGLVNTFAIKKNPECIIIVCFNLTCGLLLTLNCLALTVERYISICHPLNSLTLLTPRRVKIALGSVLLYVMIIGVVIPLATPIGNKGTYNESLRCRLHLIVPKYYGAFLIINLISPIPAMLIIYSRIFFVLRRHIRAISSLQSIQLSPVIGGHHVDLATLSMERKRWKKELKSALFLLILIVSFVVCWLPWVIMFLGKTFTHKVNLVTFSIVQGLVYVTSTVNPYLYGLCNKAFRLAVIQTFCPAGLPCMKPVDQPIRTLNTACSS